MGMNNSKRVIAQANNYITNINKLLKDMKSKISVNYIQFDNKGIVITTNKVVASSNLNIVEKYMKELNDINSNNVMSLRLLQSKLYPKISSILYFLEDTNLLVIPDIIERVIKSTHIFDNMILAFCSWVIKAFPKFNITITWVNIWDL